MALLAATAAAPARAWTPEELWTAWERERFVAAPAVCLDGPEVGRELDRLAERHGDRLRLEAAGRSFAGQPIRLLTVGRGSRKVLLWSQMHGDEPSATPALLDIADFLLRHSAEEPAATLLDELTLLMVPMLNPDGADHADRRNAQGIDVNRDALALATPEGRLLAALRDEHQPILGFNLHDQGRRITVGDSGVLAASSVLAVAGDAAGTMTAGRERARRAASAVASALEPFFPGGVGRYDEDFNPRAFGDNLTAWGTPVLLIESGGLPPGRPLTDLTRLNFVAILRVLEELARDDLNGHDPAIYEALGRNRRDAYADVVVRGGSILRPGGLPYQADLAFDVQGGEPDPASCRPAAPRRSRIVEVGDARFLAAGRVFDAAEGWIVEPFTVWVEGWPLPDWLDVEALSTLARLGVGKVRWLVEAERFAAARPLARSAGCPACPRIEPVVGVRPTAAVALTAPPRAPRSARLEARLDVLLGEGWRHDEPETPDTPLRALRALWGSEASGWRRAEYLRVGAPASFLVLVPVVGSAEGRDPEDALDWSAAEVREVWVDGVEALSSSGSAP